MTMPLPNLTRRLLRAAVLPLALPLVCGVLLALSVVWLVTSSNGLQLVARSVGWMTHGSVVVSGAQGRLAGPLTLARVDVYAGNDLIVLQDVALAWQPRDLLDGRLTLDTLQVATLSVQHGATAAAPPQLPPALMLPLPVQVNDFRLGALLLAVPDAPATTLVRDLRASLGSDGRQHRLDTLALSYDGGHVTASGELAGTAPFALNATAQLSTTGDPAFDITTQLAGTLTDVIATFTGTGPQFTLGGTADVQPFAAQALTALRVQATGLDPRVFVASAPTAKLTLQADLVPDASGALAGSLQVDNAAPAPFDRQGLPFVRASAQVALAWNGAPRRLRLQQLALQTDARGTLQGSVDLAWPAPQAWPEGSAALTLRQIDPAMLHSSALATRLDGSLTLDGTADAQQAVLALTDGRRRLEGRLLRRGDQLDFTGVRLRQDGAELSGDGSLMLASPRRWHFAGKLQRFDPAAYLTTLPHAVLNADLAADGNLQPSPDLALRFALAQSSLLDQPLSGSGELTVTGLDHWRELPAANGRARVSGQLALALGDSRLDARGGWGTPRDSLTLALNAPALARHRAVFAAVVPALADARGSVTLDATLSGFPARPEVVFATQARGLVLPSLVAERLDANGRLQGDEVALTLSVGGLGTGAGQRMTRTTLAIAGTRDHHRIDASATLPAGQQVALVATGALEAGVRDWRDSGWRGHLDSLTLDGDTPVTVTANGNLAVSRAVLSGNLDGRIPDLGGLAPSIDDAVSVAGAAEFAVTLSGTPAAPHVNGRVQGSNLQLGLPDYGVTLQHGALALRFDEARADLESLDFDVPHAIPAEAASVVNVTLPATPGRLQVSGGFDLLARSGTLQATLDHVPLSQLPQRWLVASGSVQLDNAGERLRLQAKLAADAGYIGGVVSGRPQLADDIVVRGQDTGARRSLQADADMALDLGNHFHLRASGLSARLAGQLRVRGGGTTNAALAASGSIAAQDATYEAYGQRLVVERGLVNFQGRLDDPGLNVLALRKGLSVEAGVQVTGTVQHPQVRLVSTPTVPDTEKLSWIMLGRATATSGTDSALLLSAAGAMFGRSSGGLTEQIADTFGVDELSLGQARTNQMGTNQTGATGQTAATTTGDTLTGQILTVGKRLSERAYLSYERGLTAAAGAFRLTYELTPRISVVTRTGTNNGVGVFYHFDFD